MRKTKQLTIIGLYTAILLGGQFALSSVSGIEIVTVSLLAFSFVFGVKSSILVATAFSVLRCVAFGFFPSVIILYLVYYNLFALCVGGIGNKLKRAYSLKNHIILTVVAVVLTVAFTLLDDVITPLYYGFDISSYSAYFLTSLPNMAVQSLCVLITSAVVFAPLYRVLNLAKRW